MRRLVSSRCLILLVAGCLALAAPPAGAQGLGELFAPADEARFAALAAPLAPGSMGARVAQVGQRLLGQPYMAGTLEGGADDALADEPLVSRLDGFDCVTFVESSLALARTLASPEVSYAGFRSELEQGRYRHGKRQGYVSRLHYFSEWIADNARRKRVQDLTPALGGVADKRPLRFMTSHRDAYKPLASDAAFAALQQVEAALAKAPRAMIPKEKLASVLPLLQSGDIVAIVPRIEGLDVVHAGLLLRRPDGQLHLLHAPEPGSRVSVSDKPLVEYLMALPVDMGVMIARPLAP